MRVCVNEERELHVLTTILGLGQTALELGLMSSLTVLALFLSYTMLNVCDLSTDGCFTLGAAVGAVVALAGHPFLSIPAAMLAGVISGFVTAFLQTRMGVNSLLAGIVVNTALYSINIAVMGNTSLLNMNKTETVFTKMQSALEGTFLAGQQKLAVSLIAVALVIVFLSLFLRTKLGLAIRATGNNPDMVKSSSIDPVFTTTVGLCVANAFTALSGCLLAQAQKSVNIDIGSGMVTIALASLLIGGMFFRRRGVALRAVGAVLGAFLFRLVYTLALRFDMPASMLKLVSSVIVVIAISGPYLKGSSRCCRAPRCERRFAEMLELKHVSKRSTPAPRTPRPPSTICRSPWPTAISSRSSARTARANRRSSARSVGTFLTDSGSIFLDGENITMQPQHRRSRVIGHLFRTPCAAARPA